MDDYDLAVFFPKWYQHWLVRLSANYLFWACLLLALAARIWLIIHTQGIIDGDEAQVGIQARHILQGERPAYLYGQGYMGSLPAYLIAGLFAIMGPSVWALRSEPVLLSPLLVWLTWRLAAALADGARLPAREKRRFMLTSALLAALPPLFDAVVETRVWHGYSETFVLTLLLLLCVLRLTQRWQAGASSGELGWRWASIGFVTGLGFWVDPMIIFAVIASAAWIVTYGVSRWKRVHNQESAHGEQSTPAAQPASSEQSAPGGQTLPGMQSAAQPAQTSQPVSSDRAASDVPTTHPGQPVSSGRAASDAPTTHLGQPVPDLQGAHKGIPSISHTPGQSAGAPLASTLQPPPQSPAGGAPSFTGTSPSTGSGASAGTHSLRIAFAHLPQSALAHPRQPSPAQMLRSPLAHALNGSFIRTLQSSLAGAWRSPFARALRSSLAHISRLDQAFALAFVSIPAALVGFAPAFSWGATHGWENIAYIFRAGSGALADPGIALHYPNRLAMIQGLVHLYGTCAAPHAISGALPGDPRIAFDSSHALLLASRSLATAPYLFALGVGILCIAVATLLLVRSYTQHHALLLSARRLAGLPLLFGATTAVIFCVSSSSISGLLYPCASDKVGHYTAALVLVLPLIISAVLTIARMSLPARASTEREHSTKQRTLLSNIARGLLLCGLFVYLGGQASTYVQSNPEHIIQSPGCNALLEQSDQLVAYLERSHIHYAWATIWIGNVVMFKSNERVVTADPRVITIHDENRLPAYTAAVSHATHASVLAFALSSDLHPTLLQTLNANHVTYRLARFSVAPAFDVLVVTPLNRTLSPFEGNTLGAWNLGC
ncbi:MAG: hypothetical protein H0W02_18580 [Ktedonobacteraceae bacterium]|nr:hypothetical protein [Ktedonobacteraceae bacterium]